MAVVDAQITQLLHDWHDGDQAALQALMPMVYDTLRSMAARRMQGERAGHTLQPTALVHESMIRMLGAKPTFHDRAHFMALAALTMRSVLVDQARARKAQRRGGGALAVTFTDGSGPRDGVDLDVLALDQALSALASEDARAAKIVELFYFGGLEREEIAAAVSVSVPTVDRDLRFARAWLNNELA